MKEKIVEFIDKYVVDPLDIGKPLPRMFGLTFGYFSGRRIVLVELDYPGIGGDQCLFRNGIFSFYLHLPFCVSWSLRIPYKGWAYTWQVVIGWKPFNGRPALTFRITNDMKYSNRPKGLTEGWV